MKLPKMTDGEYRGVVDRIGVLLDGYPRLSKTKVRNIAVNEMFDKRKQAGECVAEMVERELVIEGEVLVSVQT
jgi:hypothetical protein